MIICRSKTHSTEQGVAHQHGEATAIMDHSILCLGRTGIELLTRLLPFIHQAGIDRTHHQTEPSDNVFRFFAALIKRERAIKRTIRF